jgi:Zn-dependent protease
MFSKRLHLFDLAGFPVRLDLSWFVVFVLLTWSLATGLFPARVDGLSPVTYWAMGAVAALGLFAGVLLHELAHALVARRFGLEMRGITLFIFGGVAELPEEPPSAKAEFFVAVAGPIASALIAAVLFAATGLGSASGLPGSWTVVTGYLAFLNLVLVLFNCVPAFPLDGGRILRALLWHRRGDLRAATNTTAGLGKAFGFFLVILGVLRVVGGDFLGGFWSALVGMFLQGAAESSKRSARVRDALGDATIERFMTRDPIVVASGIPVDRLVDEYFYRHYHRMFPVVDGERLLGCVTSEHVGRVDRPSWSTTSVEAITEPCDETNTIDPEMPAVVGLRRMSGDGRSRLLVVRDGRLQGVVSLKDLVRYLARHEEIGSES